MVTALCLLALPAAANAPYECDNRYGPCGAPNQSGGGGGGGGGSILVNNTDLGDTYQNSDDYDDDGLEDTYDNCPWVANVDQIDDDGDGIGSACDNCPAAPNVDQLDLDGDILGDVCDPDLDGDDVENAVDLCVDRPDPFQRDLDEDGLGDACDPDMDNDGIPNLEDNCPMVSNPGQSNADPDTWGDACDDDDDADGIRNTWDNCLTVANRDQLDSDDDQIGDACDADVDNDSIINELDNCPATGNPDQVDADRDLVGDLCDDRYCFVVEGDLDNCLDPTAAFTAYAPVLEGQTGEPVRLRLFANQENQPIRYSWRIVDAPAGSRATLDHPVGAVNHSSPHEYRYLADQVAAITPDQPGTYTLELSAELAFADPVTGQVNARSVVTTTLEATGEPTGGGCSSVPVPALAWALGPAGLLLLARRRRR